MSAPARQPIDLADVYNRLRTVLDPYRNRMQVLQDNERGIYLNAPTVMKNGQPLFFAAVAITKRYVSFHVYPVHMYPDLLDGIGDLKKRMQGKSCFNFSKVTEEQVAAMGDLVRRGYERYRAEVDI